MTSVPKKLSVTATQSTVRKTRIRSAVLPCFSKIPLASKPFFKQWYIHTIDITKIMSLSRADAREIMQALRSFFGKSKRDLITVEEFCAFTGISKGYVRMHLVARIIEQELVTSCQSPVAGT